MQLDAEMTFHLEGILCQAGNILQSVHRKCSAGILDLGDLECMHDMRARMVKLLATFTDGEKDGSGYNFNVPEEILDALDFYHEKADEWLEHYQSLTHTDAVTPGERPGRYVVSRTVTLPDGSTFTKPLSCTNPALATQKLDAWMSEFVRDWDVEKAA